MNKLILSLSFILLTEFVFAQPSIQWQKCLGGYNTDIALDMKHTHDSGYILTGYTRSNDGDVSGYHGEGDCWVVKLDSSGNIQWEKCLGGSSSEAPSSIQQTSDHGYVMLGSSYSNDGDVSGLHGESDVWVVKLDSLGNIEWQKSYGGSELDMAQSIKQTTDDGYIIGAWTQSNDGDVSGNLGYQDMWVFKIDKKGVLEWQKCLGGKKIDECNAILQTADGGYLAGGGTKSNDGDVSGNHGDWDYWLVKLSANGEKEWQKPYGGIGIDEIRAIDKAGNEGYVMVGECGSGNSGQVTGAHGYFEAWLVKVDLNGNLIWQKSLGGSDDDYGFCLISAPDGYVVGGLTYSTDGDATGNNGGADLWVIKVGTDGSFKWQKTLGGSMAETGQSIDLGLDNGIVMTGFAFSDDGDVSGNYGYEDFWVVKLTPESTPVHEVQTLPLDIFPNPATQTIRVSVPAEEQTVSVSFTDMLGREVWTKAIPGNMFAAAQVDVSGLTKGMYLVKALSTSGKVYGGKMIKE